ncbi:MAG TPA: type II toxin-antitoxin system RelE/ParE family toxin [Pyrinomonadaceae bacterium]|nr:type II toxin-antitoxin system RelE/ParE family toxin [Pyrinomonadaceae bacterium]
MVVFRRIARRELDDAISWYEERREGLGQEFSIAIENNLERIASSPEQFIRVKGEIRRAVLRRFPYSIYFLTEDFQIVVLAIFHVKRDPKYLENRF